MKINTTTNNKILLLIPVAGNFSFAFVSSFVPEVVVSFVCSVVVDVVLFSVVCPLFVDVVLFSVVCPLFVYVVLLLSPVASFFTTNSYFATSFKIFAVISVFPTPTIVIFPFSMVATSLLLDSHAISLVL